MKRAEFIAMSSAGRLHAIYEGEINVLPSVADPTQAQSGRDLVFNPKPIVNTRIKYSQGVPSHEMQPFDKMYPDKLDVFSSAKETSDKTRGKIAEYEEALSKPQETK